MFGLYQEIHMSLTSVKHHGGALQLLEFTLFSINREIRSKT